MSQSIHEVAVPTVLRVLSGLSHVLEKGRAHAEQEKIDPTALLTARLYPDMYPLTRQVQVVSDNSKGTVARLAGVEIPKYEDHETTFEQLHARLEKTATFVKSINAKQFEGADSRAIELKFPQATLNFKDGWDYLVNFALPNLYFHYTTAYNILRHSGVKLGKGDFMGGQRR